MDGIFSGYPFWAAWIFLFFGAMLRGQGTYWIGRGAAAGVAKRVERVPNWWSRLRERVAGSATDRGRAVLQRLGVLAIPLAYLTVGLQTAIILSAGLMRMSVGIFTLAQLPGAAAWATIYSTIGFAAWTSAARALTGDWWPLLALLTLIVIVVVIYRVRGRAKKSPGVLPADAVMSPAPPPSATTTSSQTPDGQRGRTGL